MLLKLIVGICLVAVAAGHECGELQRLKVKQQWAATFGQASSRTQFNRRLWRNIFREKPELVDNFFTRVKGHNIYSPEFTSHAARLIGGFDMSISSLDEPEVFNVEVAHLKSQHADYNIDPQLFKDFARHVMDLVGKEVGDCFDWDAWKACTDDIAEGMA